MNKNNLKIPKFLLKFFIAVFCLISGCMYGLKYIDKNQASDTQWYQVETNGFTSQKASYQFGRGNIRVAVMPFRAGPGLSQPEAVYLTNLVRTALIKLGKFDVVSNDQLQTMLQTKQMIQKIGRGSCTTKQCIIDLGNSLECEKMFVGYAEGAFGEYALSLKMVDVVKQKYEVAEDIRITNKKKFPNAAVRIVNKLFGME
jgi:hypothetical protein